MGYLPWGWTEASSRRGRFSFEVGFIRRLALPLSAAGHYLDWVEASRIWTVYRGNGEPPWEMACTIPPLVFHAFSLTLALFVQAAESCVVIDSESSSNHVASSS